jgi:hypothetical protein
MGRGTIAIAVALAVAALVAGCGGGDDSSTTTVSKAVFIKKVDAVCKNGTERMQRAVLKFLKEGREQGGEIKRPSTDQSVKLVGAVIVPSVQKEIKEIKALGVPSGDEEKVEAIVGALEEGVETAEDDPQAVVKGSSDVIFGIASRIAGEYGIAGCSVR